MVGVLDFVREHGRGAAGAVQGGGVLQGWTMASFCDELDEEKWLGGCARAR
jgi:hypothetical protein